MFPPFSSSCFSNREPKVFPHRLTMLVLPGDYATSWYKKQELWQVQLYICITQILLESKHLHFFSKPVQEAVLTKAFGWHLKRDYFPMKIQSKAIKFVTKIDLKSVSSLVSSSMQSETTIHDRDSSSSFHFHHACLFDIQRRGTARTEGMNYTHEVLGGKSPNEKPSGRKDRRMLNHLTNYVTWEKETKK